MTLKDSYDGSDHAFEGDQTLLCRSLPDKAQVTKATVKLTPVAPPDGTLFEEAINFPRTGTVATAANGQGDWGATKANGSGFVEVDFHKRRTLAAVVGTSTSGTDLQAANLQVDVGGLYVEINKKGAIRSPGDDPFPVPADRKLPSLTVNKFKLTKNSTPTPPTLNVTRVTIRSVPTNVSVRLGKMLPFWTHLGELTVEDTSPDFAQVLQAFLASGRVENGFYVVPLVVHSDTIARMKVDLEVEYLGQASLLAEGLKEVVLPFDFSTLPKAQADGLKVALPATARVVPGNTTARVVGAFDETRVVGAFEETPVAFAPPGAVKPVAAASISPTDSQAQAISLDKAAAATAVDLLIMAVKQTARLGLDLQGDLDGKPDGISLLPRSIEFGLDLNVARQPTWVSVPLPAEFHFEASTSKSRKRYWLVVQSIDGEAAWSLQQAPAGALALQHTQDGGLSWRDTTSSAVAGPLAALLRLRRRPERFEVPIELQVGAEDRAVRVKLDRFQPAGRVDFALNFPEVADAFNQSLTKAAAAACPETEHIANGDFEQWLVIGDKIGSPSQIHQLSTSVGQSPFQVVGPMIVAPDGRWAYVVARQDNSFFLEVVDVACDQLAPAMRIQLEATVWALALHPNGSPIYVLASDGSSNGRLHLVDTTALMDRGAVLFEQTSFDSRTSLAVSRDGRQLYLASASNVQAVDTAVLEQAVRTQAKLSQTSLRPVSPPLANNEPPTALAVSPDGSVLYVTIADADKGKVLLVDTATFTYQPKESIEVGIQPAAIAVTPDGRLAVVAVARNKDGAVIVIDTARAAVVAQSSLGNVSPSAIAISPDGMRAFVASDGTAASTGGNTGKVHVVNLKRIKVIKTLDVEKDPIGIAVTPQGERVYIASLQSPSLTFIPIGTRVPAEWSVTAGAVSPVCLPAPSAFHVAALLGDLGRAPAPESAATALSQVVPVAASCAYEFSFWGLSTDAGAVADVFWLGQDCGSLKKDSLPIAVLKSHKPGKPELVQHRARLTAPAGATQAEVRFVAPMGVLSCVGLVSLKGTAEAVENGDLGLQKGGVPENWTVLPQTGSGFLSVPVGNAVQLRNSGPATAELVQTATIMAEKPFALEFEGRALLRPGAQANPRVELRWLKSDGSSAGPPTSLEVLPPGFNHYPATGTTPKGTTQVEIHLIVPSGTTLEVRRVSLRSEEPASVPLTFVAQAPGELRLSDARVVFDTTEIAPPPVPATGLCTPTPPDQKPGEPPSDTCFCHTCQAQRDVGQPKAAVTEWNRPATVGSCKTCGSTVVRAGGPLVADALRLSFPQLTVRPRLLPRPPARIEAAPIPPITTITGLGEARAKRLAEIGIDSVAKLAAASPEVVAKALKSAGVSAENSALFIQRAKQILSPEKKT